MNTWVNKIIDFWFKKTPDYKKWFESGEKYDTYIKTHFVEILQCAEKGALFHWMYNKKSFIALVILLDQFSRHIYRGSTDAYKNDKMVLDIIKVGLHTYIHELDVFEKIFIVVPFQHSVDLCDQYRGIRLLQQLIESETSPYNQSILKNILYHQKRHCLVIERFGRFPKRNKYYGILSTKEETEYIRNNPTYDY